MLWQQIGFVAMGFLLGSILFSYHIPLWMKHIDIVKESLDHNPGTFNAIHLAGLPVGLLCLAADLAKGFLPVWLSIRCLGFAFPLLPLVLAAPVAGHAFTPWYGFRGGKAIAASFGSLMGLLPFSWAVLILAFWYVLFAAWFRLSALRPPAPCWPLCFGMAGCCRAMRCLPLFPSTKTIAICWLPGMRPA